MQYGVPISSWRRYRRPIALRVVEVAHGYRLQQAEDLFRDRHEGVLAREG